MTDEAKTTEARVLLKKLEDAHHGEAAKPDKAHEWRANQSELTERLRALLAPTPTLPAGAVQDVERLDEATVAAALAAEHPKDVLLPVLVPHQRRPVALRYVEGDLPAPLLSAADADGKRNGAVLSEGGVAVLAGAGGTAKTTLALHLAIEAARTLPGADRPACGNALVVRGGPVLFASWEDAPQRLKWRAGRLIEHMGGDCGRAMDHLHVLHMAGRPLFGPAQDAGSLYTARPAPLEGWADLWDAVDATGAHLVVLDPVLAAFVGESNAAAPVREFLTALAGEADRRKCGVLLIAHSRKEARRSDTDPYDAGHVGGSTHWTDGCRGALVLTHDQENGGYLLSIAKANYGPAFRSLGLDGIQTEGGAVVGMRAAGPWYRGKAKKAGGKKPKKASTKGNGAASETPSYLLD